MNDEVIDPVKDLLQIRCVEEPFWAADRIMELEGKLVIDTLNPNRRAHIVELGKRISCLDEGQYHLNTIIEERDKQIQQLALANKSLREQVAHHLYEHYETCEGEGLDWQGPIPEKPKDY